MRPTTSSSLVGAVAIGFFFFGAVSDADARGMRGGGGIARPASRPAVSPSRPATRPSPSSARIPANSRQQTSKLIDRSPAVSPAPARSPGNRPAGVAPNVVRPNAATPQGAQAGGVRPSGVTPQGVRPRSLNPPTTSRKPVTAAIRNGTPAARHAAAVTRSRTAFAQPRPARTSAANIAIARRVTHAATARKVLSPRCSHIYSPAWWGSRGNLYSRRWYYYNSNPWWYWWGWATWNQVDSWVDNDWDRAWDYEYDDNVVFDDDSVYINDEPVASAEDYIAMGEDLADIGEPGETDKIDWLPLGVFAMSASEEDQDPQMTVQLVLAKDGRVGGTYFHARTESTREIKGSLNRETQRIAFKIGDETDNVIEVGLDSLTRDQAPIWVHFDHGSRTQTWTLIRLPPPPEAEAAKNDAQ